MASALVFRDPLVPVGEYLGSVYRPDVDYVDGLLEERNLGDLDHSEIQWALLRDLSYLREFHGIRVMPALRVQVTATRLRVPDVCLLSARSKRTPIVTEAPLLCLEVLSPRDTIATMRARCADYLHMGVPEVWIFDPQTRSAYVLTSEGMREQRSGELRLAGQPVTIELDALFAVLDEG